MGIRQKIAEAAVNPMNDPRLSPSDKALAIAIGVQVGIQVEQATLRALRQHDAETAATWRSPMVARLSDEGRI